LIKLTAPGVPDVYQGTELWDLSLVDPDNRRPVDFDLRRRMLADLAGLAPEAITPAWTRGCRSCGCCARRCACAPAAPRASARRRLPAAVRAGREGGARAWPSRAARTSWLATPRLVMGLGSGWGDTVLELPGGAWQDLLTGDAWAEGPLPVASLFGASRWRSWCGRGADRGADPRVGAARLEESSWRAATGPCP
jgi:(1->4)-alpha-D-glucan 1-alpha-D-glucosylmutase